MRSHALQTPSHSRSGSAHCEVIFCSYCAVRARCLTHAFMQGYSTHFLNAHGQITGPKRRFRTWFVLMWTQPYDTHTIHSHRLPFKIKISTCMYTVHVCVYQVEFWPKFEIFIWKEFIIWTTYLGMYDQINAKKIVPCLLSIKYYMIPLWIVNDQNCQMLFLHLLYIHVHVHTLHTHTCIRTHTHTRMYTHIHMHIHTYMHIQIHIYTHAFTHNLHACTYIHTCIHTVTCIYLQVYKHTHCILMDKHSMWYKIQGLCCENGQLHIFYSFSANCKVIIDLTF